MFCHMFSWHRKWASDIILAQMKYNTNTRVTGWNGIYRYTTDDSFKKESAFMNWQNSLKKPRQMQWNSHMTPSKHIQYMLQWGRTSYWCPHVTEHVCLSCVKCVFVILTSDGLAEHETLDSPMFRLHSLMSPLAVCSNPVHPNRCTTITFIWQTVFFQSLQNRLVICSDVVNTVSEF